MSDVYFKASLQNTLNPEVGRFDNVDNKEGTFTLEDGEYYLTNNTGTSFRVYYPTEDINSVGFTTIEFDINYLKSFSSLNSWCLLFNDGGYWFGFGSSDSDLHFLGDNFNYKIVTSPSTWLHVKCIFDYYPDQNNVHIYIDNVEVNTFTISNKYNIKRIDILGNKIGYVADAKIKNITIRNSKKHYLDTIGLTSLWLKIKSLFATKTELASLSPVAKSGDYNDLSNKPVLPQINVDVSRLAAEFHNSQWGGRDITDAFNNGTVSANIADGSFYDIFPGDYIMKKVTIDEREYNVQWTIMDCDYWINKGDTAMTAHHVVIVPQEPIFEADMNATDTTKGGYAGSEMYKKIIPACATGIVNAFGSDHILTFRDRISNGVDTSGAWYSQQCNLMSEGMVFGDHIITSSALDNIMAIRQMSAFRLSKELINYNNHWYWLHGVANETAFAAVSDSGLAYAVDPPEALGVRPFVLLV